MNAITCHYHVVTNFPQLGGAETALRTNNIHHALDTYLDEVQNGNPTLVMDGYTGEILAIANHENVEDHATDEFSLIIKGYLATLTAEEEELMDEEEIPAPDYPNDSMVVTMTSGEEVVVPLSKEQMATLMYGDWATVAYIL